MTKELLPLWLKYPKIPMGSIGWRMGYGECYWEQWAIWFKNLNDNEQDQYIKKYPAPKEWHDLYYLNTGGRYKKRNESK